MTQVDVLILGASGYGGGELLRWLSTHPAVKTLRGTARSHAGKPFHAQHPNLRGLVDGTFEATPDWEALASSPAPVIFSALPHGELGKLWPELEAAAKTHPGLLERLIVIDLSTDFRLDTAWVYGLVDWKPERMAGAKRIANPGCFATALQLALLPLAQWQPAFVAVTAATGSSGSGAALSETTHHPSRAHDFKAYKILGHQHEAEVLRTLASLGWEAPLSFVPQSAPMVRGIFATVQFPLPAGLDTAALKAHFEAFYQGRFGWQPRWAAPSLSWRSRPRAATAPSWWPWTTWARAWPRRRCRTSTCPWACRNGQACAAPEAGPPSPICYL